MEYKGHEIVLSGDKNAIVTVFGLYFPPNGKVYGSVKEALSAIDQQIKAKDRR